MSKLSKFSFTLGCSLFATVALAETPHGGNLSAPAVEVDSSLLAQQQSESLANQILKLDFAMNLNCAADAHRYQEMVVKLDGETAPLTSSGVAKAIAGSLAGFGMSAAGVVSSQKDAFNSFYAFPASSIGAASFGFGAKNQGFEKRQGERKEVLLRAMASEFAKKYVEKISAITSVTAGESKRLEMRITNEYLSAVAQEPQSDLDLENVLRSSLLPETFTALGKTLHHADKPTPEALAAISKFEQLPVKEKIQLYITSLENSLQAMKKFPNCVNRPAIDKTIRESEALLLQVTKI